MGNKYPERFIESLPLFSPERELLLKSLERPAPTAIRVNSAKAKIGMKHTPVLWHPDAFYLEERPRFTSDPAFHAGGYYVQEASSMFLGAAIHQLKLNEHPLVALDLCAAPGGKSTLLRADLHPESLLIANEVVPARANLLEENLIKWGLPGIAITQSDAAAFGSVPHLFDLIAVDAPCSGEGLFRKTPEAVSEWSPEAVEACAVRQRKILSEVWPALKPGGILIYSTCTYNTIENDENLAWLKNEMSAQPILLDSLSEGIVKSKEPGGYRFFPHLIEGEGFFISVMQKSPEKSSKKRPKALKSVFSKLPTEILGQNIPAIIDKDGEVYLVRDADLPLITALSGKVVFKAPGFPLGRAIHGKFKPAHGASQLVDGPWAVGAIELNLEEALSFLQREDVYKQGLPKGQVAVQFEGFVLGFAKSDGSRLVSQYPLNWRVRTSRPDARVALVKSNRL